VSKYETLKDFTKYSGGAPSAAKRLGIYYDLIKNLSRRGNINIK
jgi:hypothetical protein